MNAARFIQVLDESSEAWAARYGIVPFSVNCYACGAVKTTSVPFMTKKLRGLMAPPCVCGDPTKTYAVVGAPGHDILNVLKGTS